MEKRNNVTWKWVALGMSALLLSVLSYGLLAAAQTNQRQDAELFKQAGRITAIEVDTRYIRERVDRIADRLGVE